MVSASCSGVFARLAPLMDGRQAKVKLWPVGEEGDEPAGETGADDEEIEAGVPGASKGTVEGDRDGV